MRKAECREEMCRRHILLHSTALRRRLERRQRTPSRDS